MKKLFAIMLTVALSVAACGMFTACGKNDENVIKIGVFEAQTGANGAGAMKEVLGIRYANSVKNTVTIDGKEYKIKLVESDNQSDDNQAISAATRLVQEKVSVVLGSYGSSVSMKAGATFKQAKIPAIGCSCTNPGVTNTNDYYFRVCFTDDQQGAYMADYAKGAGFKKVLTLVQNGDSYSQGLVTNFEQNFTGKNANDEDVSFTQQVYQSTTTDFSNYISTAKTGNYDAIFAPSSVVVATALLAQAKSNGYTGTFLAGDTWDDVSILNGVNNGGAEGYVCSTFLLDVEGNKKAKDFADNYLAWVKSNNYTEINGNDTDVAAVTACGYDAYMTAVAAIEKAGSKNGADVRAAMAAEGFEFKDTILTGGVKFNETGDLPLEIAKQKLSKKKVVNNKLEVLA